MTTKPIKTDPAIRYAEFAGVWFPVHDDWPVRPDSLDRPYLSKIPPRYPRGDREH